MSVLRILLRIFLSTPSARRATWMICITRHSLTYFYPRPPRGGRLCRYLCIFVGGKISIHALREEGDGSLASGIAAGHPISIHALREEGDVCLAVINNELMDFYPRPPRGGRLCISGKLSAQRVFLSTPSARRATGPDLRCSPGRSISIHALREEGDCMKVPRSVPSSPISIHALREEGDVHPTPVGRND